MKWNKQASGSRKAILAAGKMPRRGLGYRKLAATVMLALANVALAQSLPATAPASQPALPPGHPAMTAGPLPLAGDATLPAGHPAMDGAAPGMLLAGPASTLTGSQATAMKGTLNITAVPARANGTSVANEPVTIEFFQDGKSVKRMEAKTDGLGKVTVVDVPLMPPTDVVLSAKHAGLFQQVMTPQVTLDAPVTDAQWKMYEPTEEMPAWTVAMQHMIVEWKPAGDGATVTEMVSTNNPSDLAWIGAKVTDANGVEKHVTMTLPLPPDARNVSLSENFDEDNSRMEGGKLVTGSPLYPGRTEFRMTYDVPAKDGALELPIAAPAAVGNLIVFVPADDTQIKATGVAGGNAMDMGQGGGKVRMYTAQNLAAGAVANLSITGIKAAPAAAADEAPAENGASVLTPRNLVMGGAFLLVLVGAALMLMKKPAERQATSAGDKGGHPPAKPASRVAVTETRTGAASLSPGGLVDKTGYYYCSMCKHANPILREQIMAYAREKGGVSAQQLEGILGAAGVGSNATVTRRRFVAGSRFDACPQHKQATTWLRDEEAGGSTAVRSEPLPGAEAAMMECPPFGGKASCSDNECPCDNATMPPVQGYLWIKPEVVSTRSACLTLAAMQGHMAAKGISAMDIDTIRSQYLPIVVCRAAITRRGLDLQAAQGDYDTWVATGQVPCRPTPRATISQRT